MSRKQIDWEAVEIQYRAGIRSLKSIGEEFDVSDAAIIKRARRDSWDRDLRAKIQAKAEAKVSAALVSREVSDAKKLTEKEVVEKSAQTSAEVQLRERDDVVKARNLGMSLFAELGDLTTDPDTFRQLKQTLMEVNAGEMSDTAKQRMEEAFSRVLSFSGRTTTYKALADALKTTISLEREVYRINDAPPDPVSSLATAFSAAMTAANFKNLNDAELADLHGLMAKANSGEKA